MVEAQRASALDPASSASSHILAVQLYLARQFDQAAEQCHKSLEMDPHYAVAYGVLGQSHASQGQYREAKGMDAAADKDQVFSWFKRAYADRSNRLAYLRVEGLWDPVRADPRFDELVRRVGIPA